MLEPRWQAGFCQVAPRGAGRELPSRGDPILGRGRPIATRWAMPLVAWIENPSAGAPWRWPAPPWPTAGTSAGEPATSWRRARPAAGAGCWPLEDPGPHGGGDQPRPTPGPSGSERAQAPSLKAWMTSRTQSGVACSAGDVGSRPAFGARQHLPRFGVRPRASPGCPPASPAPQLGPLPERKPADEHLRRPRALPPPRRNGSAHFSLQPCHLQARRARWRRACPGRRA